MRLREMVYTLNLDLPKLQTPTKQEALPGTNVAGVQISGLDGVRSAAASLSKISALRASALEVLQQPFAKHLLDGVWMPQAEYDQLRMKLFALRDAATLLLQALLASTSQQRPNVVSVRLPHPKDLSGLEDSVKFLKIGLEHPIAVLLGESIEFDAFDVGTEWLDLLALTDATVSCTLGLWWAALRVQQKRAEVGKTQEEARSVALDNNHKEVVDKTFARILERAEEHIVEELVGKCAPDKKGQPEVTAKVLVALGALIKLRESGGTIVPALTAPKAIREMSNEIEKVPAELPAPPAPPLLPPGPSVATPPDQPPQ
jgi:hypothetical protein